MEAVGLLETPANICQDKLASRLLGQYSSVSCFDCRRRIVIEALECLRKKIRFQAAMLQSAELRIQARRWRRHNHTVVTRSTSS